MYRVSAATAANDAVNKKTENNADKSVKSEDIKAFDQQLGDDTHPTNNKQSGKKEFGSDTLLPLLIKLLEQLIKMITGGQSEGSGNAASSAQEKSKGGSIPDGGQGVNPVDGGGPGGSAGDNPIPKPVDNIQTLNLGGKAVTVGGDGSGTASPQEVAATANQIQHLYDNSPTFRNMIDNSSDPAFEVSVGRRSDNTSWGNTQGRVFMNINNVQPNSNDSFQGLLAHEFAHASIDLGHGAEMERTEKAVAKEA